MRPNRARSRSAAPPLSLLLAMVLVATGLTIGAAAASASTPVRNMGPDPCPFPDTVLDGRTVSSWTGLPVSGLTVTAYRIPFGTGAWGTATTDGRGEYRIADICDEEIALHVSDPRGRWQPGYASCRTSRHGTVLVPTWDEACSQSLSRQTLAVRRNLPPWLCNLIPQLCPKA